MYQCINPVQEPYFFISVISDHYKLSCFTTVDVYHREVTKVISVTMNRCRRIRQLR